MDNQTNQTPIPTPPNHSKKLYRSRHNRIIAGILGGIGEHFNLDPTLVRIVFAILLVASGFAPLIILYLILWFIIPEAPIGSEDVGKQDKKYFDRIKVVKTIVVVLVVLAVLSGIALAAKFVYHNVIVPGPYRHQLDNCLNQADSQPNPDTIDFARYKCFRTYPHFL